MNYATPESKGISSEAIKRYVDHLEKCRIALHSLIIARGDDIVYEKYWEPFHADFLHRIYSSSKSIVALAVGFAEQDGLLSLDDPMSKYFAKELEGQEDQNMHEQTVRHMLMMSTCKPQENWFVKRPEDRVHLYFQNPNTHLTRPSGTLFEYDSTGSFVLGALVERLTGKPMMEYLKEKFMRRIGVSEDVYCLTCPGGHAWGDSGVMFRATDFLKVARFVLNKGRWEGEQLLNEEFVTAATSKQIHNDMTDGGIYYDSTGNELKKFGVKDGAGLASGIRLPVLDELRQDLLFPRNGIADRHLCAGEGYDPHCQRRYPSRS